MVRGTTCAAVCAVSLLVAGTSPRAAVPAQADAPSLTTLFERTGGLVRDTNGDGIADAVAARIVVPGSPSIEEIQAAANIAGRLGFETSAFTLPLVVRDDVALPAGTPAIAVGRQNAIVTKLAAAKAVDLTSLAPGQGLIALVAASGAATLVVAGGDDEGTLAAANVLAGRLPRLWNMTGVALPQLEEQVGTYLRTRGVDAGKPAVTGLVVDADKRGLAEVRVRVPTTAGQRAAQAFADLDAAHRRGQEPTRLNYAELASIAIDYGTGQARVRRAGLNSRTLTPPINPDDLAPDSPGERGRAAEVVRGPSKTFDLTNAYSIEGWFGDSYVDLTPDRTETTIVVGGADDSLGAAHIAARLGLESTGVTLPIAKRDVEVQDPTRETSPILVGRDNALTAQLTKIGRARLDGLQPGEGVVQVVPRAFGGVTATVVAGADAAGTEAAAMYLARRVPSVWDNRRGAPEYDGLVRDVSHFLGGRTGGGQAGQAVRALGDVLDDLRGRTIESFEATLFLASANPDLDRYFSNVVQQQLKIAPKVASRAITDPVPVIDETFDVPWEVDDLQARIAKEVLPRVKAGSTVHLEARVSESPAVRAALTRDIESALVKAGAAKPDVTVLSAYKQGYLWLTERVFPALAGKGVRAIKVSVAEYKPDFSKKYKFYQVPTRWLQELYPADEIAARDLGVPKDRFALELVDAPADIYTVEALDAAGKVIGRFTFSPKFVEREYLDRFPGWSRVDVTTGWLTASVDGQQVADARIETDPERFWDHYQTSVLPRIYDHVMKVTDNRPLPEKQPFHRDLDVEVWMSEPDFAIGIDQEQVSSLESLHEDLYFVTLDFFDALGRTTTKRRIAAPGKVYPIIHPEQAGKPGRVHVLYAGNASTKPRLDVTYREKGAEKPTRLSRDLGRIETSPPQLGRVVVRADGVSEIELSVEARDDAEAGRVADALDGLVTLQRAGLYKTTLSYEHVARLAVNIGLKDVHSRRVVANTGAWEASGVRRAAGTPVLPKVTWDHIIGPEESEDIIGKLSGYPEVAAYVAGHSYRGRQISVMEITEPTTSEQVSLAKLTTLKPTVFITGRQHANEVSSTSHILRLSELLVSDPAYRGLLKRINFVMQPIENPDGAAMAYELQKLTPTHMLHAGRYSALGMDVASQVGQADPLLPEALVRGRLWQEWLPDIYLNPHGYPSHEWVQQFAGYIPPGFRTYWSTRGWYTSMSPLLDPRYPQFAEGTAALREGLVREINSSSDVRDMNLRAQARYRKWAYGFAPYVFGQEIYRDTAIYYSDPETGEPRGSRRAGVSRFGGGGGRTSMTAWPQVTFVSGGTETPDETAQGDWLTLVTKPGFSYLMAHVKYLENGRYAVERIEEDGQRDATSLTWLRVRPVMPGTAGASGTPATTSGGTGGRRQ